MTVSHDPTADIARATGRLEGRMDGHMDGLDKRVDDVAEAVRRLTTENRWIAVALAALIGALGLWS